MSPSHSATPPVDVPELPQRRPWRWILALTFVVIALGLGGLAINLFTDVPLTISKETTYITEPLTADGKWVDYFAAIEQRRYPPEMKTDDNGMRLIVRAIGADPESAPDDRAKVYEKLGLDPALPPPLSYQEPYNFLLDYVRAQEAAGALPPDKEAGEWERELSDRLEQPWTFEDLPMLEDWIVKNGPALDVIAEAARQTTFTIPYVRGSEGTSIIETNLDEVQRMRGFARGLVARARYRIAAGDIDGANDDVITTARLGRRLPRHGFLIDLLVGMAIEAVASSVGVAANPEHPPTAAQLRRLMDEWRQLPPASTYDSAQEMERFAMLDWMQILAQGDWSDFTVTVNNDPLLPGFENRQLGYDWDVVFRHTHLRIEAQLRGLPSPGPIPDWKLIARVPRSVRLADNLVDALAVGESVVRKADHKSECRVRMLRITLAMLLYEREHGTLPPAYTVDASGNRLHSWRVLILPQLGEHELYSEIRLDEPWDSPHNAQFHAAADHLFQCPSHGLAPGETTYAVVDGAGAPFDGAVGRALADLGPDRADRLLVVERTTAVNWMDPHHEVALADAQLGINVRGFSGNGLGSEHPGGMQAGLVSGGVTFLSENIDLAELAKRLEAPNAASGEEAVP
jgi:hypothetical protein